MKWKMYVLKCDQGYLKSDPREGFLLVSLAQASVWNEPNDNQIQAMTSCARKKGMANLRIAALCIKETDFARAVIPGCTD
jgi:hypothetical protein